jgi:hypothetical protein
MYAIEQNQENHVLDVALHIKQLHSQLAELQVQIKATTTIEAAKIIKANIERKQLDIKRWENFRILQIGTPVNRSGKQEIGYIVAKEIHGSENAPLPQMSVKWGASNIPMPEQPDLLEIDTYALAEKVKIGDVVKVFNGEDKEFAVATVDKVLAHGVIVVDLEVEGEMYEPSEYEVLPPDFSAADFKEIILSDTIVEEVYDRASLATLKTCLAYARQVQLHPIRIARIESQVKRFRGKREPVVLDSSWKQQENFPALPPSDSPLVQFVSEETPEAPTSETSTPETPVVSAEPVELALEPSKPSALLAPGIYEIEIDKLKPYPRNALIYGEIEDDSNLEAAISATGWVKPLLANTKGEVLGGNRRLRVSRKMGKEKLLVEVREFESEASELAALLADNEVRDKTREQRVREGLEWKALMEKLKSEGKSLQEIFHVTFGTQENFPTQRSNILDSKSGAQSRDAIAAHVGLGSGKNYQKAEKVVLIADEIKSQLPELSNKLLTMLNEQSVDSAHTLASQIIAVGEVKAPPGWKPNYSERVLVSLAHATRSGQQGVVMSEKAHNNVAAVVAFGNGTERETVYINQLVPVKPPSESTPQKLPKKQTAKQLEKEQAKSLGLGIKRDGALMPDVERNEGLEIETKIVKPTTEEVKSSNVQALIDLIMVCSREELNQAIFGAEAQGLSRDNLFAIYGATVGALKNCREKEIKEIKESGEAGKQENFPEAEKGTSEA